VQRYANRKHDSDAGHSIDMGFHSVHEALIENTSSPIVIQIHGYASSGLADSSWQVVISDAVGINKSRVLLDIEQAFLNQSYKTCVWPYNCSYYSATNEVSAHDVVRQDGEFIHIELNTSLRTDGAPLPYVLRGLTNVMDWRPPTVTLLTNFDNTTVSNGTVNFTCSVSDRNNVINVSLYINSTGTWHLNQTKNINQNISNATFNLNLSGGAYSWNCKATDEFNNTKSGITNFTLHVSGDYDSTVPTVTLVGPVNASTATTSLVIFEYNVSDVSGIQNCSLLIDGVVNLTNVSIANASTNNFSLTLGDGMYNWSVRCFDASINYNQNTAVANILTIEIATPSVVSPVVSESVSGGGAAIEKLNFSITPSLIQKDLFHSETIQDSFLIENEGNKEIEIEIYVEGLDNLLILENQTLILHSKEKIEISLVFYAPSFKEIGVYIGKIKVNDKELTVILEIKERRALFDIKLIIDEDYKIAGLGEEVPVKISLSNLGTLMPVDVELVYQIRDLNNTILVSQTETFAIEKEKKLKRKLKIGENFDLGKYLFYAQLNYDNQTAASSEIFDIIEFVERPGVAEKIIYKVLVIILLIIIGYILLSIIFLIFLGKGIRKSFSIFKKYKKKGEINTEDDFYF
ncbi:MAG: Ig-like domain-containing protein, partial [archaeon]